jgi:hypothetical protein
MTKPPDQFVQPVTKPRKTRLIVLSPEERAAIAVSKAAAARGEFATDEQIKATWAKHGLA